MMLAMLWGVFGATWILFATGDLGLGPAPIGVIAAIGGFASFIGAVAATRSTRRWGIGPVAIGALVLAAIGNAFIPLAPSGLPVVALACLLVQQLVGDSALTVYDITETTVRQTLVADRQLGRVTSTFHVGAVAAQLVATIGAGLIAEAIGVRATTVLAPLGAVVAVAILWFSPVRALIALPGAGEGTDERLVVAESTAETTRVGPFGG
jgi:MFS family permease